MNTTGYDCHCSGMECKMLGLGVREREGIGGTATTPAVQ